ncbi:signal transduction histidine kinase [Deinococcus metalli]|uniref:histidine kinase n=1 Tax=Deinococcus metalli TaxID=1141878 RepID=A0A7W8KKI8_9DEIO|nr:HAMP domain-containing sensor histidine kinase [Deinococcus metalli]MBB5378676.1 signal transduction histidine kinase [Deinococcus metalli]GHF61616.1 two-component sensor histidine kinase [Deinococcus metalli]
MSLRWRLTLYSALVSTVIVLLSALLIFISLRSSLNAGLDASLREGATVAATQLAGDAGSPIGGDAAGAHVQGQLPGFTALRVYSPSGGLVDQLGVARTRAPLQAGYVTVGVERTFTLRLPAGGWVQATRSEAELRTTLSRSVRFLTLGLLPLLLFGVVAGYLLADRALRPVDEVARLAASIAASGRYGERLPPVPGQDEMARLTSTVNAMLERLGSTIEREKAFALAAAHELRTPLTVLQGRADLSLERPRSPEQYVSSLRTVRESAAEMLGAIESLLALARSNGQTRLQPVDLAEVITQVVAAQWPAASARGQRIHLVPLSVVVLADAGALELAVSNLLRNALTYGRDGGEVWVETAHTGTGARVEVRDDGPGLLPADLERVVQPFQRGRDQQAVRGAGLGLALVSAVAEQHGAAFTLGTRPGGGLVACLTFPPVRAAMNIQAR